MPENAARTHRQSLLHPSLRRTGLHKRDRFRRSRCRHDRTAVTWRSQGNRRDGYRRLGMNVAQTPSRRRSYICVAGITFDVGAAQIGQLLPSVRRLLSKAAAASRSDDITGANRNSLAFACVRKEANHFGAESCDALGARTRAAQYTANEETRCCVLFSCAPRDHSPSAASILFSAKCR